jgi:integrase
MRGKTVWVKYYVDGKPTYQRAEGTGPDGWALDRAEGRTFLQKKQGEVAEGRHVGAAAGRVTVGELLTGLLEEYETNGRKSLYWVKIKVNKHLRPFFGDRTAHRTTTADVRAFVLARQAAGASNGEVNRELALLRRAYRLGLEAERLHRAPVIRMLEERNVRQGFFEPAEFDALLAKLPEDIRPLATFAYYTGWRWRSEVASLTWGQVDLDAGTVTLLPGTTKNGEGRTIMLFSPLRELLEAQRAQHLALYPTCALVFHRDGHAIKSIRYAWETACTAAGLSGKIPHDFRRTAVRNMVRSGIPERVAMQMTGHRTREVFERYNIVSPGDLQEAARRLGEAFAKRTVTTSVTSPDASEGDTQLTH